ncbi:MAG: DUF4350 domain-containing protein [Acidimicrobiales bacterium]|nr:DUF4350 domain-containing protein [Acidimicrobiales bacterium]
MSRRSAVQILGAIAVLLLVSFAIGRPDSDGPPLDPESVGDLGTRGLVEFLERSGATIERGLPVAGGEREVDVTLVLRDRLNGPAREDLLDWIQSGGRAVITDSTSPLLATGLSGSVAGDDLERGSCGIPELAGVEQLSGAALPLLVPVPNSTTCFGDDRGAYVIQFPDGEGTVTGLGGAVPLVNAQLDQADNAVLAGRLLLGSERPVISIIYSPIGEGDGPQTPLDLIGANVRWFGWQLVVASAIALLWAIRRFGRVVNEPDVVELPGSLAIRATAELHRRSDSAERSLRTIATDARSRIRHDYRLPADVDADQAARTIAAHTGIDLEEAAILAGARGSARSGALEQARQIDSIARRAHRSNAPLDLANDNEPEQETIHV